MENLVLSAFPLIASSCSAGFSCSHLKSPPMSSLFFHSATRFRKTKICGCRRTVLLGFAGRCEAGEGAFQSHPPFNLHTFRPCHFPLKSSFHEGFKPLFASLGHIAPTLAKSGAGVHGCHPAPEKPTQRLTGGNTGMTGFSHLPALCLGAFLPLSRHGIILLPPVP